MGIEGYAGDCTVLALADMAGARQNSQLYVQRNKLYQSSEFWTKPARAWANSETKN